MFVGIDVGGTNTDAVLIDDKLNVVADIKYPTSKDIYDGILGAVRTVLDSSGVNRKEITQAMLGTTQCTNAIVERKHLEKIAIIRIGAPATAGIPPMVDWPADIQQIVADAIIIGGGYEYDGKEIAPLYASLHNDIANPDSPADEIHPLAEELCKLDDERRKLWKQIDDYAEGKQATLELDAKRPEYSENAVVRGFEIARQIKRLKQNITNSKTAAERAGKEGKQAVLQNALDRIAKYETELAALTAELSAEQGEKVSG